MNSQWNPLPFRILVIFSDFLRGAILAFEKKKLGLVWRRESNLRKSDELQQEKHKDYIRK